MGDLPTAKMDDGSAGRRAGARYAELFHRNEKRGHVDTFYTCTWKEMVGRWAGVGVIWSNMGVIWG